MAANIGPTVLRVTVQSVDTSGVALVTDAVGKSYEVRWDIYRTPFTPQQGELWLMDRSLGFWTFAARFGGAAPEAGGGGGVSEETDPIATSALAGHVTALDPHSQYVTDAAFAGLLDGKENIGVAQTLVTEHNEDPSAHGDLSVDLSGYATDAEVSTAVGNHASAADPHTIYQRESEKDQNNGYAGLDATGRIGTSRLGTGTPDATKVLLGDRTWGPPPAAGGVEAYGAEINMLRFVSSTATVNGVAFASWTSMIDGVKGLSYVNLGVGQTILLIDMSQVLLVSKVRTYFYPDNRVYNGLKIEISQDGTTWTVIRAAANAQWPSQGSYIEAAPVAQTPTRYIRQTTQGSALNANNEMIEIEVFGWLGSAVPGPTGSTGPAAWQTPVPWAMFTAYTIGPPASVVTYLGETFVAILSHTSTAEFDPTKWVKVAEKGLSGNDTGANHIIGVGTGKITVGTTFPVSHVAGDQFIQFP